MSRSDDYLASLAEDRERYLAVANELSAEDRNNVEKLRAEALSGNPYNGYGHDLVAAVARGWRNKSRKAAAESLRCTDLAGGYGTPGRYRPSITFGCALTDLIREAALLGVTAEEVRNSLTRTLERDDSLSIERTMERA